MSFAQAQRDSDFDALGAVPGSSSAYERRHSPRVPLTKPIRVGAPGGLPRSPVSAANLSIGGLFIDADRPVRVGARFSAQIPLTEGGSVYVEEAEVIYNRQGGEIPGFGARFVHINPASEAAIRSEVEAHAWLVREEDGPLSLVPITLDEDDGDEASTYPPLSRPASTFDSDPPRGDPAPSWVDRLRRWVRSSTDVPRIGRLAVASWWKRRGRRMSRILGVATAAAILLATVVFLWTNAQPEALADGGRGADLQRLSEVRVEVPSDTHRALMAAETPVTEVVPPPPRRAPRVKKRPLPQLVEVDDEPPVDPRTEGDAFEFSVAPGARVKRTMIYRRPERVVIDLLDQPRRVDVPRRGQGGIERFRVGRHPDFLRLVLDSRYRLKKARARVVGRTLEVEVTYR